MPRYHLVFQVTDPEHGWRLGNRVLPRRYTIRVQKLARFRIDEAPVELLNFEVDAVARGAPTAGDDWAIGLVDWLELEVESTPEQPPRCVTLHAPSGISTPEQRFPLAGVVTQASATFASKDGSFLDVPQGLDYEDVVFEVGRSRRRRRTRQPPTPERLAEVLRIRDANPRTPTAAVQHHFGISRGYARKLIKRAESTLESEEGAT